MRGSSRAALAALMMMAGGVAGAPPPEVLEKRSRARARRAQRYEGARWVPVVPSAKHELRRQLEAELGRKLSGRQFRIERKRRARGGE